MSDYIMITLHYIKWTITALQYWPVPSNNWLYGTAREILNNWHCGTVTTDSNPSMGMLKQVFGDQMSFLMPTSSY